MAEPVHNSFAEHGRARKAEKLIAVLDKHRATTTQVRHLPVLGQMLVAELAEVNPPSPATWAVVVNAFERRETQSDDPFDGLPNDGRA